MFCPHCRKEITEKDFDAITYLEHKIKEVIERIEGLAVLSEPKDSVKLKANIALLNKILPDRTKMDLDIKNSAPYELLKKHLEEGNAS